MAKMHFGVLLPHFGKETSPSLIIDGARMCEELGFHSVWVRDHLIWHPHGMEKSGLKFVEPIVTAFVDILPLPCPVSAIAGVLDNFRRNRSSSPPCSSGN